MMRCEEIRELLDLYIDGELPENLAHAADRHLLRCPKCAHELHTLDQSVQMLRRSVEKSEPSPAFRERAAALLLDALSPNVHPLQPSVPTGQWELPIFRRQR